MVIDARDRHSIYTQYADIKDAVSPLSPSCTNLTFSSFYAFCLLVNKHSTDAGNGPRTIENELAGHGRINSTLKDLVFGVEGIPGLASERRASAKGVNRNVGGYACIYRISAVHVSRQIVRLSTHRTK